MTISMLRARRRAAALASALLGLAAAACPAGGPSGAPAGGGAREQAAAAPVLSPAADPALIEWRRPATSSGGSSPPIPSPGQPPASGPRERVAIGLGGLWVGPDNPRDGPRVHYLFAGRRRGDDLAQFARTLAPFRLLAGGEGREQDGELIFHGRGAAEASPAERRMIAEWTRAVAVEAAGESGGQSPYGLAFTWHRGAVAGGVCDDLSVYLSGEVSAGSCGAGAEIGGRLSGERLQRLYGWVDGLAAFQDAGEQGVRADALLERLMFAGRGRRAAARDDVAAIEAFAGVLHHEITAPGDGSRPLPASTLPAPGNVSRHPPASPPPASGNASRHPPASPPPAAGDAFGPPPAPEQ
ncbi:MAG TPA: hypothetical protein VE075_02825 [Thermoanaerobaculia bacterium]|nr:hypothetical protein [Thermoanaerobaculia bacterium]